MYHLILVLPFVLKQIDVGNYFLLIAIATIGSAGTAPVPSASLVLIITGESLQDPKLLKRMFSFISQASFACF